MTVNDGMVSGDVELTALADGPGGSWGTRRTGIRCRVTERINSAESTEKWLKNDNNQLSFLFLTEDTALISPEPGQEVPVLMSGRGGCSGEVAADVLVYVVTGASSCQSLWSIAL